MKIIRLKEQELIHLVKRITEDIDDIDEKGWKEEEIQNIHFEDEPEEDIFDIENEPMKEPYDDFDKEIRFKDFMKKNRPSSSTIGSGRWDASSNKPYNPIKPTDLSLDKFLTSKYNKRK